MQKYVAINMTDMYIAIIKSSWSQPAERATFYRHAWTLWNCSRIFCLLVSSVWSKLCSNNQTELAMFHKVNPRVKSSRKIIYWNYREWKLRLSFLTKLIWLKLIQNRSNYNIQWILSGYVGAPYKFIYFCVDYISFDKFITGDFLPKKARLVYSYRSV